jgi:hypothetical protein
LRSVKIEQELEKRKSHIAKNRNWSVPKVRKDFYLLVARIKKNSTRKKMSTWQYKLTHKS